MMQVRSGDPINLGTLFRGSIQGAFYPKGMRNYMQSMNDDLELGPVQSSLNLHIGTAFDVTKYIFYVAAAGRLAYELLK